MLRVSLEQWRMFRAVVEHGGFNQAALVIHKSQSSVHNAVSKIEESLDVKLFTIQGRKTVLTQSGELMLRRANFLLDEAAKLELVGQTLGKGTESSLRIAIDEMFPQMLLYKVLEKVSLEFPLLQVELIETVLSGANELINGEEVDIAISSIGLKEGVSEELCQVAFIAVANPNHPLHQLDRELTVEDLKSHRQIVVRDSAISNKKSAGWLGANQRWTVTHCSTSVAIISAGLGFAWLPVSVIKNELASGVLKALRLSSNHGERTAQLYLLSKDPDNLGPAAKCLLTEFRLQQQKLM